MVSRTAKKSQRSRRASSANATAPGSPPDLGAAVVGDKVEVKYKDALWYPATIIGKRCAAGGVPQLRYRWDGLRKTSPGIWINVSEPSLRSATTDENRLQRQFGGRVDGHIQEDIWRIDSILDERGDGETKEYLVHWDGWDESFDSWEPKDAILDESMIVDFTEARNRERLEAERAAREARAPFAATTVELLRKRLLLALRKQKQSEKYKTVAQLEVCESWKLQAIHDYVTALVPEGVDASDHVTPISPKSRPGARRVNEEFHVRSHKIVGLFLQCDEEEPTRCEHVVMRRQGHGSAVALLPTMTFARAGPRADPTKIKLFVKAGFATLVGRDGAPPDWHFGADICTCDDPTACDGSCEQVHHGAISRRVISIEERSPGCVNKGMVQLCQQLMKNE